MIMVDTSVWIDYFNGVITKQTDILVDALSNDDILLGDIILAELLQGFEKNLNFRDHFLLFRRHTKMVSGSSESEDEKGIPCKPGAVPATVNLCRLLFYRPAHATSLTWPLFALQFTLHLYTLLLKRKREGCLL